MIGIENRFQIPPVIKNLLIINGILFLFAQIQSTNKGYNGLVYEYLA